jgi:hypothetical protein
MNDYPVMGMGGINVIFEIFVVVSLLILCWILEVVWRNEKKNILYVIICPPFLLYYIYKYWEEMRAKIFFVLVLLAIMLMISVVTRYNYVIRLGALYQLIFLWPYYVTLHWINK